MMRLRNLVVGPIALVIALCASCRQERSGAKQANLEVPARTTAVTTTASDTAVRNMVTELAAAKACDLIRSRWGGIRSPTRASVTGTLRIQSCEAFRDGASWRFLIGTSGWQWREAGGYERFQANVTLHGPLDIAYDEATRTASILFRSDRPIAVRVTPASTASDQTVRSTDLDDSIVGAIGGALVGRRLPDSVLRTGSEPIAISATVPLCAGTWFFSIGAQPALPDEQALFPVELGPDGIAMYGPFPGSRSVTLLLDALQGTPRVDLVCEAQARNIADAFARGDRAPRVTPLSSRRVRGQSSVRVSWARCPVVMIARGTGRDVQRFTWVRPAAESRALQQPAVHCASQRNAVMKAAP